MKGLSLKSLYTLLLAACVGFAVSVSAFQSSGMAAKMAISAEMSGPAQGSCDGCPDGDDGKAGECAPICTATGFALLPLVAADDVAPATETPPRVHLTARGKFSSPDPYPPRPRDLS